jgi:hypothetical protein
MRERVQIQAATLVVGVILAALMLASCGATIQQNIRNVALVVGTASLDVDQAERDLYATGAYDAATHKKVGAVILTMLEASQTFVRAAQAWPAGVSMPPDVPTAMAAALKAIADVRVIVHPLPNNAKILANLDKLAKVIGG